MKQVTLRMMSHDNDKRNSAQHKTSKQSFSNDFRKKNLHSKMNQDNVINIEKDTELRPTRLREALRHSSSI